MKAKKEKSTEEKPSRNFLLLEFSLLSLIAFVIIGYIVVSAVRPALEGFTREEQQGTTVVFANRYANELLRAKDLVYPMSKEQEARIKEFVERVSIGIGSILRIYVTDSSGVIVFAKPNESVGVSFAENTDVKFALERRRAAARFERISPDDAAALGAADVFVQAVPLTFGLSYDVAGVVYAISRVGLLQKQIEDTEQEMTVRIVAGLLFLYTLLFVIVWRASRTIRRQSSQLASYAKTLEQRVRERTRALEESTQRQLKQAEELSRLKDEFVFVAAHELNAPITHLRWTLDEFFSRPEVRDTASLSVQNIMNVIKSATDGLVRLVSDLLNVARLESGTIKVSVHPTDLISVVQEMVLQFKIQAERSGIALELRHDPARAYPFVLSDSERLKEVFSNLLSNAIKYNKPNGKVEVKVEEKKGEYLEARVTDTGVGMSEEEVRTKLFTKFWRSQQSQKTEGTGLGLWISKQLITRMGGEMSVQSVEGVGSTFIVRLPIAKEKGVQQKEEAN